MLTLKAPAKINWFLKVLARREDGFHEIESLIQKVSLYDELTIRESQDLTLETDVDIPVETNLVYKAAQLLKETYGINKGAEIHLRKAIPMGAGLGGGSSDAAAALTGLNSLWSMNLSTEKLCRIAGRIGSDVPFFLSGPLSYAYGRGEKLSPCSTEKTATVLLVKPPFDISTAWAYGKLAESRLINQEGDQNIMDFELTKKAAKVNNIKHFIRYFEKAEPSGLKGVALNDLESSVMRTFPVIAEIKDKLTGIGADFSLMSGSGSTVFGLFRGRPEAEKAAHHFRDCWTAVVETLTT